MESTSFFCYGWHIDEEEKERLIIRVYGVDEKGETVCVRIEDYNVYAYLELPDNIPWNNSSVSLLVNKINETLERSFSEDRQIPVSYQLLYKKKLYYANMDGKGKKRIFPYLKVSFSHPEDLKAFSYKTRYDFNVLGLGKVKVKLHEHNVSPITQLTSVRKLPTAGWIDFKGRRVIGDDCITSCVREYIVPWQNLTDQGSMKSAQPLLMGYDIEVNSSVPSAMPSPGRPDDKIFQISCVFARQGTKPETWDRYLLSLGNPDLETLGEDISLLTYEIEADLLLGFVDLMKEKQPNVCIGYNIFTFDIPHMIERCEYLSIDREFRDQGMCKGVDAIERTIEWSSSAYKAQSFKFLDAEGRLFVDLLPLVRRDYKLSNYKLKTIAKEFLKDITKDPLDVKGIFKCYRLGMKGGVRGNKALGICGKYCMKDSELVVLLFEKLTSWIALCEMAKVTNVPIFTLYTQGQQVKVFAQAYKKCTHDNIVLEKDGYLTKENDHYAGATVFPPIPGVYDKVVPFDFASLYPTTIIAYNISWDTLVRDDDKSSANISDDMCHVMEWEDHFGCAHDPKEIRKKELIEIIKGYDLEVKEMKLELKGIRDQFVIVEKKHAIENKIRESKVYREEKTNITKSKNKHVICCKRRFRWLKAPIGVMPEILTHLLNTRATTKKEMKGVKTRLKEMKEDDPERYNTEVYYNVLDQRQLALKVSANSGYGCMGVRRGYLPLMPGAMCTTYMGRKAIEKASQTIQKDWGGVLVYGDSVSGDTPILVKYPNDSVGIQTIETLSSEDGWTDYDQFKSEDDNFGSHSDSVQGSHKQQSSCNLRVWTGKDGWSDIVRIIRHKTSKKMFRVLTHTGCVDVTEDHSLLRGDGTQVKPRELKVGNSLLHSFPDVFEEFEVKMAEGVCSQKTCVKCKQEQFSYEFYGDYKTCKKCCYYSNNRNKDEKDTRPYYSDHEYLSMCQYSKISKEEAFVWGFFMADGSGGHYKSGKYTWAINNSNLEYLEKAKNYLSMCEPHFEFKILDTMESSGVYKLVPSGKVRLIAQKYHQIMYDKDKHKIVPYVVFNSDKEIKEWFFEGYYTGDGYKSDKDRVIPRNKSVRMDCKGKIGCQGLYTLMKQLGYKNVSINTREDKPDIFRINASINKPRKDPIIVKKVIPLPNVTHDTYVYDLETKSGVFHAGIGELIVKNTDSNYITFPQLSTAQECWDHSIKVAKEVSKLFPPPMSLAYEEKVYWRFFILTKKRYMSLACERDGVVDTKISKKGVLLQRRDNSAFVRKVYGDVVMMVFQRDSADDIMYYVVGELNKLFSHSYPLEDFIITKAVGDIGHLTERNCTPSQGVDEKGKTIYTFGSYKVKLLEDGETKRSNQMKLKKAGSIYEYYTRCLPAQVQLAIKMRERGVMTPAGTRLEYVITTCGGVNGKQYEKIESSEYFSKHAGSLSIDYLYYLKQLSKPLDQILDIIFKSNNGSHNEFIASQYKIRLNKQKMVEQLKGLFTSKLKFV